MLTPEEIIALAIEKAKVFRDWESKKKSYPFPEFPDFNDTYLKAAEMAAHISIHAEENVFPDKLFKKRAPNQSPDEFEYTKENYKPKTLPYWNRAINVVNRVWNKQNYSVSWDDDDFFKDEKSIRYYFEEGYPVYNSVVSLFESVVSRFKINDPNGVLCVKPKGLPTQIDETGEVRAKDNILIEPIGIIYRCSQIVDFVYDESCLVLLDEKSLIPKGNTKAYEGLIFEYYDKETIYRIEQTSRNSEKEITFNIQIYYNHQKGYLPVSVLRGMPIQKEKQVYFKSIYYDAVPSLDDALYDSATLRTSKTAHAYPQRWEYADACSKCEGTGIFSVDGDITNQTKCNTCLGTGRVAKHSPLGTMQLVAPTNYNEGDGQLPAPPAGYIQPESTILEFLDKQFDKEVTSAFAMLNIDISESNVKGSETALGKQIDREELFSLISTFSNEIFSLFKWFIKVVGEMRYGDKFKAPNISPPNYFAIRTVNDLTEELVNAKNANIPEVALSRIMQQYIDTRFSTSSADVKKITSLILKVDSLLTKTPEQIYAGVGVGIIPKWKAILHEEINIFIDELIEEDKNFMELPLKEQRVKLIDKAKQAVLSETPKERTAEGIIERLAKDAA